MYDLIIKNGLVIDGTGAPAFHGDVAILNGKIARIARNIKDNTKEIIDAQGLTVTPGFIDSHSHSDTCIFEYSDMREKIEQGITTSVGGQCGSTNAPASKELTAENARQIGEYGKENELYKTFGTMTKAAKNVALGSNLISFVGHGALRMAAMGKDNRVPTDDEMNKMKELLREAMENGAVGLSFGLIYTPSCYAKTDELIELAKVVKEYEGLLSAHIRNESFEVIKSVDEFIRVVKAVDVKAVISHHKSMHKENWGKVHHSLKMIEDAVNEGYDIYCDIYPYCASHTSLSATIIAKEYRAASNKEIAEMLKNPEIRKILKEKHSAIYGEDLNYLMVSYCAGNLEYNGMRMGEIAKLRGQEDHFETAFDLLIDSDMNVSVCSFAISEDDIETVMKYPRTMICTDSNVALNGHDVYHPRLRGTFPRVLGRYVRERKVVPLYEMIRKCTSMPASVYGLSSKGILREGFDADICVFNADTIIDRAYFDNCHARCEGLNYVLIGGEVVVEDAVYNGKRNGGFIFAQR